MGRCDSNELCNGITGVQYLVCKTWREALPMAMAYVTLIEAVILFLLFLFFFVILRYRDINVSDSLFYFLKNGKTACSRWAMVGS